MSACENYALKVRTMNQEVEQEALPEESTDIDQSVVSEEVETSSELAPEEKAPEQTPEEIEVEKETKRQAAFNTQYGKTKQAERERDALRAELAEANRAKNLPPPVVGQYPNEFEYDTNEEFENAKSSYLNNLQLRANHNAQIEAENSQLFATQQAEQQKQTARDVETAQTVLTKARTYGIEEAEIQKNTQALIDYGMSVDIFRAIAQDEESPLLIKHLAANSQEVQALSAMNQVQAGAYIATVLKPKAIVLKPKSSQAPTPATAVSGAGVDPDEGKYPHIKGAVFE